MTLSPVMLSMVSADDSDGKTDLRREHRPADPRRDGLDVEDEAVPARQPMQELQVGLGLLGDRWISSNGTSGVGGPSGGTTPNFA